MDRLRYILTLVLLGCLSCLGGDILTGYTFAPDQKNINNTELNQIVNGAVVQPSFLTTKTAISGSPQPGDLMLVYENASGLLKKVLYSDAVPSTNLTRLQQSINQASHGFAVGDIIYYTGSAYSKAKADASGTVHAVGVVSAVADANNFTFINEGVITGLTSLSSGSIYYLSGATAGASTTTAPTTAGQFDKQIFIATSTTTAYVQILAEIPAATGYVPTGVMLDFGGGTVPTGFLLCDGSAVSRTTYAALFAQIGTTWGVGDGTTTFNVPDLRGRVCAGKDNMGGSAANRLTATYFGGTATNLAAVGGSESETLSIAEMPAHHHGMGTQAVFAATGASTAVTTSGASPVTGDTGGGNPHNITQPTAIVNKIIKI
ncbi:MAG TPA: tail fiber protein [Bryobacteraceae bacterium]|jgi:microcystin-dependent protein